MQWQDELTEQYGLSGRQAETFLRLLAELESANDRRLTAVTERDSIINIHFRDSLSLLDIPAIRGAQEIIDIGSGAGFPGLPLAIALPSSKITLLESNAGKCEFINRIIVSLGLKNASTINDRAEDLGRSDRRESYDVALARAVAPLPVLLEYALPLVRKGGSALLQRGRRKQGDSEIAESVSRELGGRLSDIVPVIPYPGAKDLHIWIFQKQASTPDRYPRRAGIPGKRPLAL